MGDAADGILSRRHRLAVADAVAVGWRCIGGQAPSATNSQATARRGDLPWRPSSCRSCYGFVVVGASGLSAR